MTPLVVRKPCSAFSVVRQAPSTGARIAGVGGGRFFVFSRRSVYGTAQTAAARKKALSDYFAHRKRRIRDGLPGRGYLAHASGRSQGNRGGGKRHPVPAARGTPPGELEARRHSLVLRLL